MIVVPAAVGLALLWYPYTPIGKLLIGTSPTKEDVATSFHLSPDGQPLKGQIGKAATPLLPGGRVKIDRTSYDALSEGGSIERGDIVLVVRVEGTHLIVRKVSPDHVHTRSTTVADDSPSAESKTPAPETLTSETLESLDLDPFDDPLG